MPYYLVISGQSYTREKEIAHEVFHRPISFLEKVKLGKRKHGMFGPKEIELEIMSNDKSKVTALRDTALLLKQHKKRKEEEIVDGNNPLASKNEIDTEDKNYRLIELKKGTELILFKTSFMVPGTEYKQIHWASRTDTLERDLFSDFTVAALNKDF